MDFMDIFHEYLEGRLSVSSARARIKDLLPELLSAGKIKEYARATYVLTYFMRYEQYNETKISTMDFLLFMHGLVLFVGRFPFPRLVTDAVRRDGEKLGLYVTESGEVDVIERYPEAVKEHAHFIKEVYSLSGQQEVVERISPGDAYVKRYTKFTSYRSLEQKVGVHCAVELPDDYSLMISLPTGGGKSLITQILAAFMSKLTLVVVPTVSLAKDQYLQAVECIADEAVKKQVFCYRGNSDNSSILAAINKRTARLVFTSPEALLKNAELNQAIRDAAHDQYIQNVIIDEAHIVPDWGTNFRPDFQIFSVVLRELRELSDHTIRTYMLSATLSDDVVNVLFQLFGNEGKNVEFRCDALRKEPRFVICDYRNYAKREQDVIDMVKGLPKPLIVYVIEPKVARQYCRLLKKEGFSNIQSYTGDTGDAERESLLEKWKNNEFDVMVATSAFGMGVDKGNVRTIIHACVPENLSRFYQEVGRAGRDGLPSLSILTHYISREDKRNDLNVAFGLVNKSILTKDYLIKRFTSILKDDRNLIEGDVVTADLSTVPSYFTKEEAEHAGHQNMSWNANTLLLLHRQGYIDIQTALYDQAHDTYLFRFKVLDLELLDDRSKLETEMTADRQEEYDMRVDGYRKIAGLVGRPRAKCWGRQFVSLFPLSQPICSGCPADEAGTDVKEDVIRIRKPCMVSIAPDPPGRSLRRHMGVLHDLIVPVADYVAVDLQTVADKTSRLNLTCMVYPDDVEQDFDTDCMTLTYSEFLSLSGKCPWILRNGMMIVLCDDRDMSNKMFEAANKGVMGEYRKVWCCKPTLRITSKNRAINEILNCHTCELSRL
jgi:hypothetical protein